MIAKIKEKEEAIKLRKQGFSYREILEKIPVAKSSLSLWLKSVGLSKEQKQRLTEKKLASMKKGAEKVHIMRMERWKKLKEEAFKEINKLTKNERWLLGISLYWAEGAKEKEYGFSTNIKFSNSDVLMLLIFQKWLEEFFGLAKENLIYELYIHQSADYVKARKFWAKNLSISEGIIRVYFKKNNIKTIRKNTGDGYNGLMRIGVLNSISIVRKMSGWFEGIYKNWGVVEW